jgi:predicted dehydrogenase
LPTDPRVVLHRTMALGIGLLGLGKHGIRYARHLAQGEIPGARLAAVWRRDQALGEATAAELGARYHPRPEALLADPEVQAVIAAIPAGLHGAIAPLVAAAHKPLLLEKPLATELETGQAIVRAFEAAGVPLCVAQTLRYDPLLAGLAEALSALGPLRGFGFEQRLEPRGLPWEDDPQRAGGGVLFQTAIHTVDALRVVTQAAQVAVVAATTRGVHYQNLEDHALLHLELHGGPHLQSGPALGDIRVSKIGGSRHHHFALYAEGGGIEADFIDRRLTITRGRQRTSRPIPEQPTVALVTRAFVDALQAGLPMPITGSDALENVRILVEARQRSGGKSEIAPALTA